MTTKIFVVVRNPSESEKLFPPIPPEWAGYKFSIEEYQEEDWVTKAEGALKRLYDYLESEGQGTSIVIRCENETIFNVARAITLPYSKVQCIMEDYNGTVISQYLEGGRMVFWPNRSDFFVHFDCLSKIFLFQES